MSRLLFLLPAVPMPLDAGAKIRNHGLLKLLGEDHELDAVAFGSVDDQAALERLTRRSQVVPPPPARTGLRRVMDMARSELPDMAQRLKSTEMMRAVERLVEANNYDAVQAEGIEMARYLRVVPPDRRIYDAHNAEFLLQRRLALTGPPGARLYSRLQWRRLERFERHVVEQSRMTLAVSNHDANQLLALAGASANVRVASNGIEAAAFPFCPPAVEPQPNLLFLGKLDFRPNSQAVGWFIDSVLGHLPDSRLFAVGTNPPPWLVAVGQHDERIAVTGYVADERPYIERCAALILPLRTGGGSRLKALIAMACGLPIISTQVGMEGLDVEPEKHFLLAETAAEWIASVRRVTHDLDLRRRLARSARELVEQRYDWAALRAEVRAAYAWLGT